MTGLEEMGLTRRLVYESILTTYSPLGVVNAAPMGVRTEDMEHVIINPYKTTQTFENLKHNGCGVANFLVEPALFYRTALKSDRGVRSISDDHFERAHSVNAPRLRGVDGFIEVSVVRIVDLGRRSEVVCDVEGWGVLGSIFKPYCRGVFAVIEAVIHATRIKEFLEAGRVDEADGLVDTVECYRLLVDRVAPDSEYSRMMCELTRMIEEWRRVEDA